MFETLENRPVGGKIPFSYVTLILEFKVEMGVISVVILDGYN